MTKRVAFTRKEILAEVTKYLKEGPEHAAEYAGPFQPEKSAAFEASYYRQGLFTIKAFLEARYEA